MKNGQEDLFGRLSDSDSDEEQIDDVKPTRARLDLAMSSSSSEENDEEDEMDQQELEEQLHIRDNHMTMEIESSQPEKRAKVVFSLSGDEDSDSIDFDAPSQSQVNLLKRKGSACYQLLETPKRRKNADFHRAMCALERSSVEFVHSKRSDVISDRVLIIHFPKQHEYSRQSVENRRNMVVLGNFNKEQLARFEVYRRSNFNKNEIRRLITKATGSTPSESVVLAIRTLAKMFVGDIVETACDIREAQNKEGNPIKPEHIIKAFDKLHIDGALWPPYGTKRR
ncbi:unnamed protein product [Caenorhabditis sp. 36 PRJEB53466]|nr:unnamed protein product [Caenorhabditis sp. 36 PRJEB53466]